MSHKNTIYLLLALNIIYLTTGANQAVAQSRGEQSRRSRSAEVDDVGGSDEADSMPSRSKRHRPVEDEVDMGDESVPSRTSPRRARNRHPASEESLANNDSGSPEATTEAPPSTSVTNPPNANGAVPQTAIISERYEQTWRPMRFTNSIGYNSLNSVVQYEKWIVPAWGYSVFGTINKINDTATETHTVEVAGFTNTDTKAYAGVKNNTSYTLGGGVKFRIWQNDWVQINWGGLGLLHFSGASSYPVPTSSVVKTTADTRVPDTYSTTYTDIGSVSKSASTALALGPRIGAEVYLKWFPNVSIVGDMQMLMTLSSSGTTTTSKSTRTIATNAGVDQAPTGESSTTITESSKTGGSYAVSEVGSSGFCFTGTWGIRYTW